MTDARKLRLLDVNRLADECADQTARFFSQVKYDTGYCYELFRRAIVGRNSYAWEKVYLIYQPLVAGWVRRHSGQVAAGEEVDYFVNCAFEKIWSAMHAEKFNRFQDLAGLLYYLKMCVHSVIVDHNRGKQVKTVALEKFAHLPPPDVPIIEKSVTDELEKERLWQIVISLLQDEKELIVVGSSFLYDLKPSEIYAAYPDQFESLGELYRVKRNLLNRLRRNPILRQFLSS
jgi:DNA-directed RNA polymerase specialized sigma24 family protein